MIERRVTVILVALATAAVPASAAARHGGSGAHRAVGACIGSATSKLKVTPDHNRLEVQFELDQNRNGVKWRVVMLRDSSTVVRTSARTKAPGGSFSIERAIANPAGVNEVTVTATHSSRLVCTVHVRL